MMLLQITLKNNVMQNEHRSQYNTFGPKIAAKINSKASL